MSSREHKETIDRIVDSAIRLLSDGIPRSARELSQGLQQFDIYVHKSQINSVLYHYGKPSIGYDDCTYSYFLAILPEDGHIHQVHEEAGYFPDECIDTSLEAKPLGSRSKTGPLQKLSTTNAEQCIEALRLGIPPKDNIAYLTVGRQTEITELIDLLDRPSERIRLLKANYGSGKTHLLRLLQEEALRRNFAVSLLTLDAKSGVRFNRLDEIFGEIVRNLRVPHRMTGIEGLFRALEDSGTECASTFRKYRFYGNRQSPQLQAAVEWWIKNEDHLAREMIAKWLVAPHYYVNRSSQEELYKRVHQLSYLTTAEREKLERLRKDGTFKWSDGKDYSRTWTVMQELHKLTQEAGLDGLIVLIDEFEDVISNMTRPQQIRAFYHLFQFYKGRFPGLVVLAVTPDFVENCRRVLLRKSIDDFTLNEFENLPFLEISPLTSEDLFKFTERLVVLYEHAYQTQLVDKDSILETLRQKSRALSSYPISDRPRHIAKYTTQMLDRYLE